MHNVWITWKMEFDTKPLALSLNDNKKKGCLMGIAIKIVSLHNGNYEHESAHG